MFFISYKVQGLPVFLTYTPLAFARLDIIFSSWAQLLSGRAFSRVILGLNTSQVRSPNQAGS